MPWAGMQLRANLCLMYCRYLGVVFFFRCTFSNCELHHIRELTFKNHHSIQLVFSNFYLGIAIGALEYAANYTISHTRAWPFGGDVKESPTEEFYILERYGNFFAHLRAAEALADRAGDQVAALFARHGSDHIKLSGEERGEIAEWVASVKVVTTDVGLRVTSGIFEVTGSRATSLKVGLDRYWRNLRTHTLHDPVAYKNRELGRYVLLGEIPQPTWYT